MTMLKRKPLETQTADNSPEHSSNCPIDDLKHLTLILLSEVEALEKSNSQVKRLALALLKAAELTDQVRSQRRHQRSLDLYKKLHHELNGNSVRYIGYGIDFFDEIRQLEIELIRSALELTGGNQRQAARLLRIKATTLNEKKKRYKI